MKTCYLGKIYYDECIVPPVPAPEIIDEELSPTVQYLSAASRRLARALLLDHAWGTQDAQADLSACRLLASELGIAMEGDWQSRLAPAVLRRLGARQEALRGRLPESLRIGLRVPAELSPYHVALCYGVRCPRDAKTYRAAQKLTYDYGFFDLRHLAMLATLSENADWRVLDECEYFALTETLRELPAESLEACELYAYAGSAPEAAKRVSGTRRAMNEHDVMRHVAHAKRHLQLETMIQLMIVIWLYLLDI